MYPPEPWNLRGQLYLSLFAVPRSALAPLPGGLATTVRRLPFGRQALVGAAWVRYEPGGVLHYQELLSAVLVREGWRPRVCITEIWVDSAESRDGGRELWGIPKDLAELSVRTAPDGRTDGVAGAIGSASFRAGVRLPGRWPTPMRVVQDLGGTVKRTTVRGRAGLRLHRAAWRAEPGGPLGYLAGRRPLLTLALTDFRLTFGVKPSTPAGRP
ncbi:acetoacetate decarboxylase family protein [Actinoplanes sp. NPDC049681]|uniref:acetoacetate decarboxylase family protein n=1 Tax=Actinoplanes sp. NPDC049681 TaxID=3363905 RepID=UPI003787ED27